MNTRKALDTCCKIGFKKFAVIILPLSSYERDFFTGPMPPLRFIVLTFAIL
jgi:hypothetical protein